MGRHVGKVPFGNTSTDYVSVLLVKKEALGNSELYTGG